MKKVSKKIAMTGRVKSFLKNPESRLPVSCTGMVVEDSMEGTDGIEESWLFASKALRNGAGVALDLSELRAKGVDNGKGLVSSGVVSFAKFYSLLNQELRRGGSYRNGAISLYLDYNHPDAKDFLEAPREVLPWVKRALYVDDNILQSKLLPLVIQKLNEGSLFLAKKRWDDKGERLYTQVCCEIYFKSRSTCLLMHLNLGQCTIDDIPSAFVEGMESLCELHPNTGVGDTGIYRSPWDDKQVGLGVLGLANLLAIEGISYREFVESLEHFLDLGELDPNLKVSQLIYKLHEGFYESAKVARNNGMERAYTIAPTANCSYSHRDRDGYTTSPEISPPVAHPVTKEVDRDSETMGVTSYQYHPDIEVAANIPWELQYRLIKAWQRLMNTTSMAHAISFNVWDTATIDKDFIADWLESDLWTIYYTGWRTQQDQLDKTSLHIESASSQTVGFEFTGVSCNLDSECVACAE